MSKYKPIDNMDPVPEEEDIGLRRESSDTDVESVKGEADETLSFLGRKRRGKPQNTSSASRSHGKTRRCLATFWNAFPWVLSFFLSVVVVYLAWRIGSKSHLPPKDLMFTLAEDVIEYRIETTYASEEYPDSEYQGWPNDEKDRLWEQYEKGNYLWVDQQTASKLPAATEHAPTEEHKDDYVVGLAVFHVLHCLNVLRRSVYPRRYNSSLVRDDATGTVDWARWHHVDHCLETIRRDVLCHADTAATTWDWIAGSQMTIHAETRHVCRDFDALSRWAYDRHVDANQRSHVEDGRVVDYTGMPPSEEWKAIEVHAPDDWAYTKDDL